MPKSEDLGFWQQVLDWRTHSWWEWQKKVICAGSDKINANWFAANPLKVPYSFDCVSKPELVELGAREMFMKKLY